LVYPKGDPGTNINGQNGDGFLSVYLEVADDAASLPSGWSQHADFALMLVSRTDERFNTMENPTSRNLKVGMEGAWGFTQFLKLAALNDLSNGYIVNDTIMMKCDMTNISSSVPTAAAAAPTTAGMYPAGNGGLVYIPARALASNTEPVGS
jgi:hypothetical protein